MVRPCFTHLLNDPERTWIPRYVAAQNFPTTVADHEKAVQDSEGKRRHGEEIHRRNGLAVVPQKRQPALTQIGAPGSALKPT